MTDRIIDDYTTLFQGNALAIGTEKGGALHIKDWLGGCPICGELTADNKIPHTTGPVPAHMEAHLIGEAPPIGVYPMVYTGEVDSPWQVHWGCVDFDEGDAVSLVHARNVYNVLQELDVAAWIERSRSKGYHVWVFCTQWVPAQLMRQALLAAAQIVSAPLREINPKQIALKDPTQLGNYVRLPYPGAYGKSQGAYALQSSGRRCVIDEQDAIYPVGEFTAEAMASRVKPDELIAVAELYLEPQRPKPLVVRETPPTELQGDMLQRMDGLSHTIYINGPIEPGAKRGKTLFKLAMTLCEKGNHTVDEIRTILHAADADWGKFTERGEPHYIDDMLDKIIGGEN